MTERNYIFDWDKSQKLLGTRGLGFEEIIQIMEGGAFVRFGPNPNQRKYPGGEAFEVQVGDYIFIVPFEMDGEDYRLKTLFPSRKVTKEHKVGKYDKE